MLYEVEVMETVSRRVSYVVDAEGSVEARRKAENGETEIDGESLVRDEGVVAREVVSVPVKVKAKRVRPAKTEAENREGAAELKADRDSLSRPLIKDGVDPGPALLPKAGKAVKAVKPKG